MAKVTVHETPSQQILAKAAETFDVKDATGRVLTLKRPNVLSQFRLIEAIGDSAKNEVYYGMVSQLIFVTAIDGEACHPPTTKLQVEALISRLGDDGVITVIKSVGEKFGAPDAEAEAGTAKK